VPYGDPDVTDPMTLNAVALEVDDPSCIREMAACFVEEYMRSGFDAVRILQIFRSAEYAGPYMVYQALGEAAISTLVEEELQRRGQRISSEVPVERSGIIPLPVLQERARGEDA
jgi:hypothetical protein